VVLAGLANNVDLDQLDRQLAELHPNTTRSPVRSSSTWPSTHSTSPGSPETTPSTTNSSGLDCSPRSASAADTTTTKASTSSCAHPHSEEASTPTC